MFPFLSYCIAFLLPLLPATQFYVLLLLRVHLLDAHMLVFAFVMFMLLVPLEQLQVYAAAVQDATGRGADFPKIK